MALRNIGRIAARYRSLHSTAQIAASQRSDIGAGTQQPGWPTIMSPLSQPQPVQQLPSGMRHLHSSIPALAVEEVLIPSMGDSITEGTRSQPVLGMECRRKLVAVVSDMSRKC